MIDVIDKAVDTQMMLLSERYEDVLLADDILMPTEEILMLNR